MIYASRGVKILTASAAEIPIGAVLERITARREPDVDTDCLALQAARRRAAYAVMKQA